MKKHLFIMASAALLALSSCSSDDFNSPDAGTDGTVTFTAAIPSHLLSRAYGDGTVTKQLSYAVYEAGTDNVVYASDVDDSPAPVTIDAKNFSLTLNLVKGKSYDFVFWADATTGSPYTFTSASKSVAVDYAGIKGNDEDRDAFFQSVTGLTVSGPMRQSVELRRPFAQLNIGTSDLAVLAAAKTEISDVAVTVSGVRTSLNLLTGVASGSEDVTFTSAIPQDETFPVEGYDYLAMNYILTGEEILDGNVQQAQRELMSADITVNFTDGKSNTFNVPNLPLQRNYRTNVYGALLTSPLDLNIVVEPEFYTPGTDLDITPTVSTPEELTAALTDPSVIEITVPADLDLSSATPEELTIDTPKKLNIAQGATVTLPTGQPLVANADLTLTGGGTISNGTTPVTDEEKTEGNTYRQLIRVNSGDLVIDGVTLVNDPDFHYHGNGSAGYPYNSAAISYYNDANVTINNARIISGEFTICGMGRDVASGTVTLTNSYFESKSSSQNGTGNWSYAMRIFGSEASLTDCTVIGTQGGVSADSKGLVMTINSGTYTTVNTPGKVDAFYPVYATNGATVIIKGGKFWGANSRSTLAQGTSTFVAGDNDVNLPDGRIEVYGGVFSGLPYSHTAPATAINAPAGYKFVLNEGTDKDPYKWTVVKE